MRDVVLVMVGAGGVIVLGHEGVAVEEHAGYGNVAFFPGVLEVGIGQVPPENARKRTQLLYY